MAEVLLIYRIISHVIYQSLDSPTQVEQTTVVSSDFVLVVQLRWKYLMSFHCWFLVPVVAQVVPVVVQLLIEGGFSPLLIKDSFSFERSQ
jgi:hypothetical protein